jgi:hypothetical protein
MASTFQVQIPNREQFIESLSKAPEVTKPTLQAAINKAQAILAKYTIRGVVPWDTGNLAQTFAAEFGELMAIWKPTALYAEYVEFGTAPHKIEAKNKQALFWKGADHPVKSVNHPGTKAQPYMEKILELSTPEINVLFLQALQIIVRDIAESSQ